MKLEDKITLTERQFKQCVDYSNKKSNNAREKFSELIGKKGEFVVLNFLKKKLKLKRIQGPDLEIFTRREKKELKENNIMLSDNDLFINDKFKIQVKTRYVGESAKFIKTLDDIKEDPLYFTVKKEDVIFTNNDSYVFFVLVNNEKQGIVVGVVPAGKCKDLVGRHTDYGGLQLHIPKFQYDLEWLK